MTEPVMQLWVDGEQFVFRGDEIDELHRRIEQTYDRVNRFEITAYYGRQLRDQ